MGFQGGQVNLDDLVVELLGLLLDLGVGLEQVLVLFSDGDQVLASGGAQVGGHAVVIGEHVAGGAQLGAHVADRALAGGGNRGRAGAEVLDDGVGSAGHGELVGQLDDDVLRRRPAAHGAGELDADDAGVAHLPGQAGHNVGGVRSTHADGQGTQAAAVHRVGVGANDESAGEGVLFQHHLVDDPGTGPPEAHAETPARGFQELIDLVALVEGILEVGGCAHASLDQVIAVDSGRDGHALTA